MGFLEKLNELQSSKSSNERENKNQSQNNDKTFSDKIKERRYQKYNIFEGINVIVTFPQKELRIKTYGGATRGLATLGLGLVGLAATSSVKQKKENIVLKTKLQVVEKGIVFKNACDNGTDLRIPYENVIDLDYPKKMIGIKGLYEKEKIEKSKKLILTLLENQLIQIELRYIPQIIIDHLIAIISERKCGAQFEETGWGLEHAENNQISTEEIPQIESTESSRTKELEKIINMYEKGLLTEDEFAAMKKKIIEN